MGYLAFVEQFRSCLARALSSLGIEAEEIPLEQPPSRRFGDIATPLAMRLAKRLGRRPRELAEEIAGAIEVSGLVREVRVEGPGYINAYMDRRGVYEATVNGILREGTRFAFVDIGRGRKVRIEHTSVNPNKAVHVGHARNMVLGDSLARLLTRLGYRVEAMNYIDDTGVQIADTIVGFKVLGFPEDSQGLPFDQYCGDVVYVSASERIESDPSLAGERKRILREIEEGRGEIARFARSLSDRVLREQLKTAWRLGVYYDYLVWESDILRSGLKEAGLKEVLKSPIVAWREEGRYKGCLVAEVSKTEEFRGETDEVLIRSDGTMTYLGKDIIFAMWKLGVLKHKLPFRLYVTQPNGKPLYTTDSEAGEPMDIGGCDLSINVIGGEQRRPQRILKLVVASIYGEDVAERYVHYAYEAVVLSKETAERYLGLEVSKKIQRMSGRKGIYVNVDPFLDMLRDEALKIIKEGGVVSSEEEAREAAERIAVSALRYGLLTTDRDKVIVFDVDKMLDIRGESGAYILYSYARACSILAKAGEDASRAAEEEFRAEGLSEIDEALLDALSRLRYSLVEAGRALEPKIVAKYAYDLATAFNEFYEKAPVIKAEGELRLRRLQMVMAFKGAVEAVADVLGLKLVERM